MKIWIVPSNDHTFRISEALQEQKGMVDWRMSNRFVAGDIVFIYMTKPEQCIRYRMEVVATGFDDATAFYQERFWVDKDTYYDGLGSFIYARFRLLERYQDDVLSLHHLHEHGLQGYLQGVREIKNEELRDFLLNPYETLNDDVYSPEP